MVTDSLRNAGSVNVIRHTQFLKLSKSIVGYIFHAWGEGGRGKRRMHR